MAEIKDESRLFDYYCVVSNFDSKGKEVYGEGNSNVLCRWPQEDYESFPLPPCISMTMTGNGGSHSYCIYISFLDPKTLNSDKKPVRFAICIVTHNPFFSLFKSILSYIFHVYKEKNVIVDIKKKYWAIPDLISLPLIQASSSNNNNNNTLKLELTLSQIFMNNIVKKDNDPTIVKLPGFEYSITLKTSLNQLPYTDPICFYTLFFSLDINNIVQILSYMIQEQKILFYSSNVSTIEFCCEALISLLYPFYWQHVYIPIVPLISLDYLNLPLPSLLGICTDALASPICAQIMSSRIVVNLDRNTVISPISINEDDSSTGMIKLPSSIESYFINQFNTMLYKNEMLVTGQNRTNDPTTINWINNIRIVSQSGFYPLLSPIMPMINEIQTADPEILVEKGILNKIPKEFINFMKSFLETQMFQSFLQDYIDNDPSLQLFIFGLKEYNNNKHKIDPVVKILCDSIQEPVIINQRYIEDIENYNKDNDNKENDKKLKHKLNIPTPPSSAALLKSKPIVNQFPFFDEKLLQVNGRMRRSSSSSNGAMTLTRNSIGWHAVDFDINTLDLYYIGNTDKENKSKSSLKLVIKNRSQSIAEEEAYNSDSFNNSYTNNNNTSNNINLLDIISELKTPSSNFNSNNGSGGFNSVNTGDGNGGLNISVSVSGSDSIVEKEKENNIKITNISSSSQSKPLISLKIDRSSSENNLPLLCDNVSNNSSVNSGNNNINTSGCSNASNGSGSSSRCKIICSNGIITDESPYYVLRNPSTRISKLNKSRRNTVSIMSGINENDTIESIENKINGNNGNKSIQPIKEDEIKVNVSYEISQSPTPPPISPIIANNTSSLFTDELQNIPQSSSVIINESCEELSTDDSERESDMHKLPEIKTPPLDRRLVDDLTKNSDYEARIKSMNLSSSLKGDKQRPFAKLRKNIWSSMKSDLQKDTGLSQSINLPVQHPNN